MVFSRMSVTRRLLDFDPPALPSAVLASRLTNSELIGFTVSRPISYLFPKFLLFSFLSLDGGVAAESCRPLNVRHSRFSSDCCWRQHRSSPLSSYWSSVCLYTDLTISVRLSPSPPWFPFCEFVPQGSFAGMPGCEAALTNPALCSPESHPSPGRCFPLIVWHPLLGRGLSSNSLSTVGQESSFLRCVQPRPEFVRSGDLVRFQGAADGDSKTVFDAFTRSHFFHSVVVLCVVSRHTSSFPRALFLRWCTLACLSDFSRFSRYCSDSHHSQASVTVLE